MPNPGKPKASERMKYETTHATANTTNDATKMGCDLFMRRIGLTSDQTDLSFLPFRKTGQRLRAADESFGSIRASITSPRCDCKGAFEAWFWLGLAEVVDG